MSEKEKLNAEEELTEEEMTETEPEAEETEQRQCDEAAEADQAENDKADEAVMERLMRLQADFENYKKRTQKEKLDTYQFALEDIMTKLLPVLDNLDRAEAAADDSNKDSYREGVQMVFKQLVNILQEEGLAEIKSIGEKFDPNFHHGVAVGEDSEKEDQEVLEVFQKGYTFKDKVIRPAMVKVNNR